MEGGFLRDVLNALEQRLVAMPADFDAAVKVGFRARHLENALRPEGRFRSEDVRIWFEAHAGAAAIGCASGFFQFPFRLSSLESHAIERLLARDLDLHPLRECVGDGNA